MEHLKEIMKQETSKDKSDYMEKIFAKLNKVNTSLMLRLAWALAKAYYKQAIEYTECEESKRDHKKGMSLNKKA